MTKITVVSSTLRDGSHGIRHQFTREQIKQYSLRAEKAGIPILVVGHGNGLGASSLHLGRSLLSDRQMLRATKGQLKKTKLAAFAIPGFATLDDIDMAISEGVEVMFIASHCTEATVTKQYIEYCVKRKITTYGVLMMSHMIIPTELARQAALMQNYEANGVLFMDSAGALLPWEVYERARHLNEGLDIPFGFHPHNNLGLAVFNGLHAVTACATILDGTSRGLGAGAGNLPLEIIVPLLHKLGYTTGIDEDKLMDCAEYIRSQFPPQDVTPLSITSGLAGVFSGFKPLVEKAAKEYGVSGHEIFRELGGRKVVAGQEDAIIEVARGLSERK